MEDHAMLFSLSRHRLPTHLQLVPMLSMQIYLSTIHVLLSRVLLSSFALLNLKGILLQPQHLHSTKLARIHLTGNDSIAAASSSIQLVQ